MYDQSGKTETVCSTPASIGVVQNGDVRLAGAPGPVSQTCMDRVIEATPPDGPFEVPRSFVRHVDDGRPHSGFASRRLIKETEPLNETGIVGRPLDARP